MEGCVSAYGAWKPLKRDPEISKNLPALCENTQPELCIDKPYPRRPLPIMAELLLAELYIDFADAFLNFSYEFLKQVSLKL